MPAENKEWLKHYATLPDGGPLYTETDFTHTIVEPWNAVSSLAFLVPALLWAYRLRHVPRENAFLLYCACLLFIGGCGSTLYHAFRSSEALIVMDYLPMAIATLSISIYFWLSLFKNWYWILLIILPTFLLRYLVFPKLGHHNAINASYFLTGVLIFLPNIIFLIKNEWRHWHFAFFGLLAFAISLAFRQIDAWHPPLLPMGTHFLWHLFGALGCHFVAAYIFRTSTHRFMSV